MGWQGIWRHCDLEFCRSPILFNHCHNNNWYISKVINYSIISLSQNLYRLWSHCPQDSHFQNSHHFLCHLGYSTNRYWKVVVRGCVTENLIFQYYAGQTLGTLWQMPSGFATGESAATFVPKNQRKRRREWLETGKNKMNHTLFSLPTRIFRMSMRQPTIRSRSVRRSIRTQRSADTISDSINSYSVSDADR